MLLALFLAAMIVVAAASIRILVRFGLRTYVKVLAGFAAVLFAFVGFVKLTGCGDDERPHLIDETADGHRRLRHPTFDFALAHPGDDFVATPDLADKIEPVAGADCDVFAGKRGDGVLAACAVDADVSSRAAFYAELAQIRRGLARAATPHGGLPAATFGAFRDTLDAQVRGAPLEVQSQIALDSLRDLTPSTIADDVGYANGEGSAYLHQVSRGIHLRLKVLTVERGIAMLVVVSPDGNVLADTVTSFDRVR